MRRGHTRARDDRCGVWPADERRADVDAGGEVVDLDASVAPVGLGVVDVVRGDCEDVVRGCRGEVDCEGAEVAGCGDEGDAGGVGGLAGVVEGGRFIADYDELARASLSGS